jgi:hypothetical protein
LRHYRCPKHFGLVHLDKSFPKQSKCALFDNQGKGSKIIWTPVPKRNAVIWMLWDVITLEGIPCSEKLLRSAETFLKNLHVSKITFLMFMDSPVAPTPMNHTELLTFTSLQ